MGGRSRRRKPGRRRRFNRNNQFAKFGSTKTLSSANWIKNEAWPIQVRANSLLESRGKTGVLVVPVRLVTSAFQTSSRKNVRGAKWFAGVSSLKERGSRFRRVAGFSWALKLVDHQGRLLAFLTPPGPQGVDNALFEFAATVSPVLPTEQELHRATQVAEFDDFRFRGKPLPKRIVESGKKFQLAQLSGQSRKFA